MSIKALFVDLGGVLIINKARKVRDQVLRKHGTELTTIQQIFKFIHTSRRTEEELNSYLASKGVKRGLWDEFVRAFYNSELLNKELYGILKKAHSQGILIVYTTNNSSGLEKVIDKFKIKFLADIIINSSMEMIAKPDEQFWRLAFRETKKVLPDVLPENILVIDDNELNCRSAELFGATTILYVPKVSDKKIINLLFNS